MFIRVPGDRLKLSLLQLLQGTAKVSINFMLKNSILYLQTAGILIDEIRVPIEECDETGVCDITVTLDKTLELINDKEIVNVEAKDNILEIKQDEFKYMCDAVYESRVDGDMFSILKVETLNRSEFTRFVSTLRGLDDVAKLLAVGLAPIHIYSNVGYVYYSNTLLIDKLSVPNCCMSNESMRRLAPILQRSSKCTFKIDHDQGLMYCSVTEAEAVAMSIKKCDPSLVKSIKDILISCQPLGEINVSVYSNAMEVICRAYSKIQLELSICEDGLRISVDLNGKTSFHTGSKKQAIVNIQISIAQLAAINRIFGEYSNVLVERGERCICLKLPNSEKRLLLSGMIY